jgi:hypothetical protein
MGLGQAFYASCNTLMTMAARQLGQAHAVSLYQPDTSLLSAFNELAHASIAAGGFKIDFDNRLRCCFQTNTDRMETEKNFGRRHAPIIVGI